MDPGLRVTGYGGISVRGPFQEDDIELLEAGLIRTELKAGIADRLKSIYQALEDVAAEFKPDRIVIEKLYTHYNHPTTAILMGHVRGVVCLLSGVKKIALASLASTHIKKSVAGHGHADKWQVQRMVQHYLHLKTPPKPPDVADALAVAISYAFTLKRQ